MKPAEYLFLAAASMLASLCCACGSGSSSDDAAGDDAGSVTIEGTNVTDETGDISAEEETDSSAEDERLLFTAWEAAKSNASSQFKSPSAMGPDAQ